MSIAVGSSNGVYIASEIAELVRQLSHEAERDGRDTARADAKTELALGLEQAEASCTRRPTIRRMVRWRRVCWRWDRVLRKGWESLSSRRADR